MISVSFWKFHLSLWPLLGINFFFISRVLFFDQLFDVHQGNAFGKAIIYGAYPTLIIFYLFIYWKFYLLGYKWNKWLQNLHLFGSLGSSIVFYAGIMQIGLGMDPMAPRRYYLFNDIRPYLTFNLVNKAIFVAMIAFFLIQILFIINLIITFKKRKAVHN